MKLRLFAVIVIALCGCQTLGTLNLGGPASRRRIVLTPGVAQGTIAGQLVAPGNRRQSHDITVVDVTAFRDGGTLMFEIAMMGGESSGSFDLFPATGTIPTEGAPVGTLAGRYDIPPNATTRLAHRFASGQVFRFNATGNWFSRQGSTNGYSVKVAVVP